MMFETSLTKLFKKKEDVNLLKNHWFIHNRCWQSKLMEKCLVKVIEFDVDRSTPPLQIGGVKNHSTADHIVTVTSLLRVNEYLRRTSILTL